MSVRNYILLAGLTLFLIGYAIHWAYHTLYRTPREQLTSEIKKLTDGIAAGKNSLAAMNQFNEQSALFYYRTLPPTPNTAQSEYAYWLLELLQESGFEKNNHVNHTPHVGIPSLRQPGNFVGANYQFTVQCTGSLEQLSYFLFEFYHAPFLHRLTSMTLVPIEGNTEQLTFHLTIDALALNTHPYPPPLGVQMPTGYIPRLASSDFATYQVIAGRNLLQTAKGGLDQADYTFLTGIVVLSDRTEVWFSVRTNDSTVKKRLGDPIQFGSFSGKIVEILGDDIVLEREGQRWLLASGESLNQAFALPPETAISL